MAITSSAKKAIKRSDFLRERNAVFKLAMKKAIKAVRKGAKEGTEEKEMTGLLQVAYSAIDKAARRKIVHKKNASRKKSRLSKVVASVS